MKAKLDALTAELANAITACERSPLVPLAFEQLGEVGDTARNLRDTVLEIKKDLPLLLLKSSEAELSELTTILNTCAEFAQKSLQMESEVGRAFQLMAEFDDQVLDLAAHAHAMATEAEYE